LYILAYVFAGDYPPKASCLRPRVMKKSLLARYRYLTNHLWLKFHQIYNLSTVGDRDKLIRF